MKIYLSGPIDNCTDGETKDWRNFFKAQYPHVTWFDPLDISENLKNTVPEKDFNIIIPLEKNMILESDVMIVYPWKPSSGTAMEVMYAFMNFIPVVAIKNPSEYLSPWIEYHCDGVFDSFKDAMEYIEQQAENWGAKNALHRAG